MNKSPNITEFLIPDQQAPALLLAELTGRGYRVEEEPPANRKSRLFDTFDWRLLAKGLVLVHEAGGFHLCAAADGREIAQASGKSGGGGRFSHDFPPGPLREKLDAVLAMRLALPLLDLYQCSRSWAIRNVDDKLVLRCRHRELQTRRVVWRHDPHPPAKTPPGKTPPAKNKDESGGAATSMHLLVLEPVTGYRKPCREALDFLTVQQFSPLADLMFTLYRQAGLDPAAGKKDPVVLQPHWPSVRAARLILRRQYQVMRLNEAGVLADLDSEFLHDFRVALRRSRAVLARVKGVMPPAAEKRFRPRLAELARMSNRLRDLDVYLLERDRYRELLPPCLQEGLEPLFATLAAERRREFARLKRRMKGAEYGKMMRQWGEFLAVDEPLEVAAAGLPVAAWAVEPEAELGAEWDGEPEAARKCAGGKLKPGPRAREPVGPLAEKAIGKACARLMAHGRAIGPDSPDEALHALRLDCKKLRYLFEFFVTLFPPEEITPLIRRTKKLQDNLGDFNDLFVQQESLRDFLLQLGCVEKKKSGGVTVGSAATAAAIGALIALLNQQQVAVRRDFAKTFKGFAACEYRKKLCPDE